MRKVYIDSMLHYGLRQDDNGKILFLEFGTGDPEGPDYDACPRMEHREPFKPDECRVVEVFEPGEQVEFIYSSFKATICPDLADNKVTDNKVHCGDDLGYHLCKNEQPPELDSWADSQHG